MTEEFKYKTKHSENSYNLPFGTVGSTVSATVSPKTETFNGDNWEMGNGQRALNDDN